MIRHLLAMGIIGAIPAVAQHYAQRFWFDDGAGVELYTETTGSTAHTDLSGSGVLWWDEATRSNKIWRVVQDGRNESIFGYELEARRGPTPDAITITLKPSGSGPKTVSAAREFTGVKYGQEVKLEILSNPSTGERVYDVFRPVEGPTPYPGSKAIDSILIPKLVVNGVAVAVKSDLSGAKLPRLYVPGHGAYLLSWTSRPNYQLAGYLEKNRVIFLVESEYVDMTFPDNVLKAREGGPVWVYHDPGYLPQFRGGNTCLLDSYQ